MKFFLILISAILLANCSNMSNYDDSTDCSPKNSWENRTDTMRYRKIPGLGYGDYEQ